MDYKQLTRTICIRFVDNFQSNLNSSTKQFIWNSILVFGLAIFKFRKEFNTEFTEVQNNVGIFFLNWMQPYQRMRLWSAWRDANQWRNVENFVSRNFMLIRIIIDSIRIYSSLNTKDAKPFITSVHSSWDLCIEYIVFFIIISHSNKYWSEPFIEWTSTSHGLR